ncbi:hypothetical protein ACLB2K_025070 [Fragaria x ananassa]
MAARASRKLLRDFLLRRTACTAPIGIGAARHSSSAAPKPPKIPKIPHFSKRGLFTAATLGLVIAGGAYASTVDEATFCGWLFSATKLVNPIFALLDPEVAHRLGVSAAARGWVPREKRPDPPNLGLEVWGRKFSNPIGLAAGFDKNAEAVDGLLGLGFGFVEIGSVTPIPQEGNPKPRVFRLLDEGAIINRYGFNSEGIIAVAKRLGIQHGKRMLDETSSTSSPSADEAKGGGKSGPGILGVNLGKNKTSEDAASDYVQGVHSLSQYADYLVINVSSPNTPGLRMLQGRKELKDLVKKVQAARDEMQLGEEGPPPLLVKIAPDLSKEDLEDIAAVARTLHLDGLPLLRRFTTGKTCRKSPCTAATCHSSTTPSSSNWCTTSEASYIQASGKSTNSRHGGLLFRRPAPTGTLRRAPPAVQYLWQPLQKCRGWFTL